LVVAGTGLTYSGEQLFTTDRYPSPDPRPVARSATRRKTFSFSPPVPRMKTLRYARRLIGFNSTSSLSNRVISKYLEMKLTKHGFVIEKVDYRDSNNVRKVNIIAKKGNGYGGMAYFAHTDTVPADDWFSRKYGAWEAFVARERLYGRGSCDMKGSIACMLTAAQQFPWNDFKQPLYLIFTADEETGFHGARHVVEQSTTYREMVEHNTRGVIGEPTGLEVVHAHKGLCIFTVTSHGRAAHSSTRLGLNSNLAMIPFLAEMKKIHDEVENDPKWQNSLFDPPSLSWNLVIDDPNKAVNITSPKTVCKIYTRPMPGMDMQPLVDRTRAAAEANGLDFDMFNPDSILNTDPASEFVTETLKLVHRTQAGTVSYGTDGGMFTELENLIVYGPGNIAQAHTRDEWIAIEQLSLGTEMYAKLIQRWCCSA
jgi:acetylornithine deacetylase